MFSNEAALKYFLMGSFSTGILLLGITFIYGATGSFHLTAPVVSISTGIAQEQILLSTGLILLFAAMNFKVSAAPFHFWTPDVYDGAPTVFTSFMATIAKAAGFIAFINVFNSQHKALGYSWTLLLTFVILSTLLVGNIIAIFQRSVKRMLAYSSIAQAGFMLLAVFALNKTAMQGLILYSAAYSLATIGLFAILIRMYDYTIDGFNGLAKSQPVLAVTATIFLLSLTGIPLTAGFQSKFLMLVAAIRDGHHHWLVFWAILCAAISAYYYLKIIQAMFFKVAGQEVQEHGSIAEGSTITTGFKVLLVLTAILIILLGIFPSLLTDSLLF
jgi:NADH-quinone oxidoreductase subunit N